jgi:ribosomal protein S18 acetylase RimI-like enzyme
MSTSEFTYHVLEYPFPADFVAWYPYTKPEVIGDSPWLPWLQRVVGEDIPGVRDRFVAARHERSGQWAGVVWASVSETTPELAHFGWFYVEEQWRGSGVGGRVTQTYLNTLEAEEVRVIMLPTEITNERAIGMYHRRGWRMTMVDPTRGGVWMVREPAGFYEEFFAADPDQPLEAWPPEPGDYVALDYLLARPSAAIRLLPIGLVGSRRFTSFYHDWEAADYSVAQQGRRPLGLGVHVRAGGESQVDAFGLGREVMRAALEPLVASAVRPQALVAENDAERRAALETLGLRPKDTVVEEIAGAPLTLCRYAL